MQSAYLILRALLHKFALLQYSPIVLLQHCNAYLYRLHPLLAALLPALQLPMFWALLRSARRGNMYSKSLVPAALIIPLLGLYDGLASYFHVLPWAMHLVPFGVVTFVVFML